MAGVFNPTDATEYNPTNEYAGGLQLGYSNDNANAYLNTILSKDFYQIDLTAGTNISEELYLGINGSIAKDAFSGLAGYVQYAITDDLRVGTRVEYFQDNGIGAVGDDDDDVLGLTLTLQYQIGDLIIMPELRLDKVSTSMFLDDGIMEDQLSSFVLAVVYGF